MDGQQNGAERVFVYAVNEVESSVLCHRHDTDLSLYLCKCFSENLVISKIGCVKVKGTNKKSELTHGTRVRVLSLTLTSCHICILNFVIY